MAKQPFFKLPKDKQDALIKASIKEFSAVSFMDASINKIIKEAKIPRGSFYMYFDNKIDLYNFIVDQIIEQIFTSRIKLLKKKNFDLLATYIELFEHMYKMTQKKERQEFFKNIFLNINYENENRFLGKCEKLKEKNDEFLSLINKKQLNYKNNSDITLINEMYMTSLLHAITKTVTNSDIDKIRKEYYVNLSLLKNGTYKERGD